MSTVQELLQRTAARHDHLCPRQVLGVRMGLAALRMLGLESPIRKPTGLIIAETDGCFVDGIEVSTGATVGHRTLRIVDLGKMAATFVDVKGGRAVRLAPRKGVRTLAFTYAPGADERYVAQLEGYQAMPEEALLSASEVELNRPLAAILSSPDARVTCSVCGEEIINQRELAAEGLIRCQTCAGTSYYAVRN